ncbi:MAG: desulfoferrodoxin family protein, partial [Planctomycetota bacterium]
TEKHVPVVEQTDGGLKVKVGSVPHPMTDEHYIEWVQVIRGDEACRKYLKPGQEPEAEFCGTAEGVIAREYCNVHGLWQG